MTELTPKQEAFCLTYIETGNASEAYRKSYDCSKMANESVNRLAKKELDKIKIRSRVDELQNEHKQRHNLTVDDLLRELEEARTLAKAKENPAAMAQATMGKAKILGFDKQLHEVKADLRELPSKINIIFTDEPEPQITG